MKTNEHKLAIIMNERSLLKFYLKEIKGNKKIVNHILLMLKNTDSMINN